MPYSDSVERNPMSKMKWEMTKGNTSEERLRYIVVTKQPPNLVASQNRVLVFSPAKPAVTLESHSPPLVTQQWKMPPPGDLPSQCVTSTVTVAEEERAGRSSAGSQMLQHGSDTCHLCSHQQSHLVILSPLCREPGEGGRPQHCLVSSNYLAMVVNFTIP